jgi:hypothetical protein
MTGSVLGKKKALCHHPDIKGEIFKKSGKSIERIELHLVDE